MPVNRKGLALPSLALGSFVIGTAELVVVGILNLVAVDLGVSMSTAGWVVTTYALGNSIGSPIVTALTTRFGRQFLLRVSLAAFVVGNLVAVVAANLGELLIARTVTGSIHGLFIGVASTVAAGLVPAEKRGRAISTVFGGIAVATVFGVPLGTLMGESMGWQASFTGIVVIGVVALIACVLLVPPVPNSSTGGIGTQVKTAFAPKVVATLVAGLLAIGGSFTALTYLAAYLSDVSGIRGGLISVFMLVLGLATAAGIVVGGRLADRDARRTILASRVLLVAVLLALYFLGKSPVLAGVLLAVWGLFAFSPVPSFQLRVISLAGPGGDLAATLGASAVNAGIACGTLAGGWALSAHGIKAVVLTAAIICAVAVPVNWAAGRLTVPVSAPGPRSRAEPAEPDETAARGARF